MRIIRFLDPQGTTHIGLEPRGGAVAGGEAQTLAGDVYGKLTPTGAAALIGKLLAPIAPVNIFCIGLNYREHANETKAAIPEQPIVFMKPITAVTHPGDPIVLPACCVRGPEVDYECELAVVIGKQGRNIKESDALDHVLGYTCGNDVSARKWQKSGGGGQWIRGKSFDTFCPLGPVLVTSDEIPDPQALTISTTLNGTVMQSHTTGDMIFSVRQLIAFLSQDTTLLSGTLIMTGTPQGVGAARTPPVFLKAGDDVVIEVGKIGKLRNPVKDA
jgi:2-keto-4-pentenoate hydratase/2-oxohepta-3-ene-1,7-dioic acid hydratase in catechol pathway